MSSQGFSLSDAVSGGLPGMAKYVAGPMQTQNAALQKKETEAGDTLKAGLKEGQDTRDTLMKAAEAPGGALVPPKMEPPPKQAQTTPLQIWGSSAMWIAAIGGLLTRRPLINSLNASAAVINAYKQHDKEATEQAFEAWKVTNENAMKMSEFALNSLREQLEAVNANDATKLAYFNVTEKALNGEAAFQAKTVEEANKIVTEWTRHNDEMRKSSIEIEKNLPVMRATTEVANNYYKLQALKQSGKGAPEQIAAATQALQTSAVELKRVKSGSDVGGDDTTSPDDRASAGAQAATGMPLNQIVPGYGKPAVDARKQARSDAITQIMSEKPGMTAKQAGLELANRTIEFQAGKRSEGQLITMKGATKQAVDQLDFNIDKATEAMDKLGSSDISPVINAIARGEEKWTGNPAYAQLYYFLQAAGVESARIQSGGQASTAQLHQGAMERANEWSTTNMTPKTWKEGFAPAMKLEGRNKLKTYDDSIAYQRQGGSNSPDTSGWTIQKLP